MVTKLRWLLSLLVLSSWTSALADDDLPGPGGLARAGAKLEKLWGEGSFTEGGALAADGSILFSDIGNRIMRFDPRRQATSRVFREPSGRANGLIFDPKGRLIAAEGANTGGGRRVSITERDGTVRTLADRYQGQAVQQPQRRRRRPPAAGSTSPTRATSATSPASSTSRPSSGSTPTAPSPGSRRRPPSRTAWPSAPTARRSTSPTTARRAGSCWPSTSTPTATCRAPACSTTSATAGASTA